MGAGGSPTGGGSGTPMPEKDSGTVKDSSTTKDSSASEPDTSSGEGDAEAAAVGEIGKPLQARRMLLTKDQLPFRALGRPPMRHPAL